MSEALRLVRETAGTAHLEAVEGTVGERDQRKAGIKPSLLPLR